MALPAGFSPASFRLEDGCLIFRPRQQLKLVSAAGIAPAIPRFQAEHVAATPRAENPERLNGCVGVEMRDAETLGFSLAVSFEIGGLEGSCTRMAVRKDPSRRQRGALLIEPQVRNREKWCFRTDNYPKTHGGPAQAVYKPAPGASP